MKQEGKKKKAKTQTPFCFSPPLLHSVSLLHFLHSTSSPCCVAQGNGDWGLQTVNSISSVMFLRSHIFLCSSVGPFPWVTALSSSAPAWSPFPLLLLFHWHWQTQGFALFCLTATAHWLLPVIKYAWWAQPCPEVCPLELTGTSCVHFGAALPSACRGHPCSSPNTKTLTPTPNTQLHKRQ